MRTIHIFFALIISLTFLHIFPESFDCSRCEQQKECSQSFSQLQKDIQEQLKRLNTPAKTGMFIREIIEGSEPQHRTLPINNTLTPRHATPARFSCSTESEKFSVVMQLPTSLMASAYAPFAQAWIAQTHLKIGDNKSSIALDNTEITLQKNSEVDQNFTLSSSGAFYHHVKHTFSAQAPLQLNEVQKEALKIFHTKGRFYALEYVQKHKDQFPADSRTYKMATAAAGSALVAWLVIHYSGATI